MKEGKQQMALWFSPTLLSNGHQLNVSKELVSSRRLSLNREVPPRANDFCFAKAQVEIELSSIDSIEWFETIFYTQSLLCTPLRYKNLLLMRRDRRADNYDFSV